MVFLERVFEPQELRRWKSCPDSFGLSGQRVVQKEALRTRFIAWERAENEGLSLPLFFFLFFFLSFFFPSLNSQHNNICNANSRACAQLWDNSPQRADWKYSRMMNVWGEAGHQRRRETRVYFKCHLIVGLSNVRETTAGRQEGVNTKQRDIIPGLIKLAQKRPL